MKRKKGSQISSIVVLTVLIALLASSTTVAQEPDPGPIAAVAIRTGVILWKPLVEGGGFLLTISGPKDFYQQQEYRLSDRITFRSQDSTGKPLADGVYKYELRLLPTTAPAEYDEAQRGLVDSGNQAQVQSGSFAILNGSFVIPEIAESDADPGAVLPNDVLHYDDVIITGSLCTGWDCANGEAFGYDTIKLKENNLRLYFEDTSVGTFPSGDWRIRANDTTSGGASYFAIDDATNGRTPFRIESGAPNHSLYVEDYGRVGLGTSVPYVEMHIVDGDSPTIRLDQDGSSGWTAQRWDMCGNETNFFIRDVTNGSKLTFRIQPNTPSNTLCLRNTGNVGIGTWSPAAALEVERSDGTAKILVQELSGTTATRALLKLANNGNPRMVLKNTDTDNEWYMQLDSTNALLLTKLGSGVDEFRLYQGGNLTIEGTLTQNSDVNAKENFAAVDNRQVLAALTEIPITSWNFKTDDAGVRHIGPMAQDFYAAFGLGIDERHIAPQDVEGVALAAIQGLNEIVAEKNAQISALQEQNAQLEARLTALEQTVGSGSGAAASSNLLPWLLFGILALGVAITLGKRLYRKA